MLVMVLVLLVMILVKLNSYGFGNAKNGFCPASHCLVPLEEIMFCSTRVMFGQRSLYLIWP